MEFSLEAFLTLLKKHNFANDKHLYLYLWMSGVVFFNA